MMRILFPLVVPCGTVCSTWRCTFHREVRYTQTSFLRKASPELGFVQCCQAGLSNADRHINLRILPSFPPNDTCLTSGPAGVPTRRHSSRTLPGPAVTGPTIKGNLISISTRILCGGASGASAASESRNVFFIIISPLPVPCPAPPAPQAPTLVPLGQAPPPCRAYTVGQPL